MYDEETEELSEEYENLSGDIADLTKTASTPGGISLFTDSSKTEYKSTYEILRDISKIYDELTDKEQAQLLQKLFGKTRAQTGAAILSNFDQAEKAMQVMRDSAGSADREMGIIEESLNYKINAFKETWTGFLQELIDRGLVGQIVDFFTMLSELVTNLTSSFGALDTVMSGLIAFSVTKFMGKGFINFNKENGFSFANPFSKDKADETIEESESARKTKEIETNVANVETKIDELNAKEITLGSNEPAISNLEQVKTEIQEIITLEQEAANAFQATQENINRMNINSATNADNIDYLLNIGEVEDELDDIGRTFSDSIESAPIANTFNNVIDDQAKAWQELAGENTDIVVKAKEVTVAAGKHNDVPSGKHNSNSSDATQSSIGKHDNVISGRHDSDLSELTQSGIGKHDRVNKHNRTIAGKHDEAIEAIKNIKSELEMQANEIDQKTVDEHISRFDELASKEREINASLSQLSDAQSELSDKIIDANDRGAWGEVDQLTEEYYSVTDQIQDLEEERSNIEKEWDNLHEKMWPKDSNTNQYKENPTEVAENASAIENSTNAYETNTASAQENAAANTEAAVANTEAAVSNTQNAAANTASSIAAMENATAQGSVGASAVQASVGLEAATLAADEEAIAMERSALESGNAAKMMGQVGGSVSALPSFLSGGLSKVLSLGGSVISMMGNMAIAMLAFKAVAGIFSFIDKNIIHYNENMIKAGKEATDSINKTVEEYEKKTSGITSISESLLDNKDGNKKIETTSEAIDNLAKKYVDLSKGVDQASNKNISLSDEEYKTFLDTSNQIADIMPELVTGTDSAGNSILNLGDNAEQAAEKMQAVLDAQQQMARTDLLNNLEAQQKGILSQNAVYQKQLDKNKLKQGEAAWIFNPANAAYYTDEELAKMEYDAKAKINNLKKDEQNIQKQMKDNWKSFIPTIQDLLKLDSDFTGLNLDIQSQLLDSIGNLDASAISKMVKDHAGNADEFTAYLNDTFIAPFQDLEERGMTDRLTALFDFDNTKMTLQEYKDYINDELMTIFSTDKSQVPVWKSILGLDDLKEQQKRIDNVLSDTTDDLKVTKEQFDSLTMGDRNIAYDLIVNDKFEGTFSELKKRIKETKAELNEQDLFGTPLLDKYNEAVKEVSDNGGDVGKNFDAYGAALKSLKEQYDKGLVGTDTFKKGARMFSIGGVTDADNFIENYKRISKWFNDEDPAKGINKFLKDMEKLSLVKFNKDGSFVTTFDDVREGAEKAKVPLELFVSMFDKIEEFGGYNDFFATKGEGFETVGEITGELAAARAEYQKLLETQPKNKSAIKAKEEEIKSLEDRLKAAQKTLKDFVNGETIKEYTENYNGQRKAAQDTLKGLNDSKNFKKASDEEKKVMLEAIKSGFENSGLDSSVYKNLGINKNGRIVLDVNASNKRIDNVLDLYSNGEVDKTLKEYGGRTVKQVVAMYAKEMGLSIEDYIKKVTGGTEDTGTTKQEPTDPMEKYNQVMQDSTSASRDNTNATKELTGAINTLINKDNPTERDKGIGVDLTNRPLVPSVIMNESGWDTEKGSLSTVNTVGYTDENGKEYVVTPILPNGEVLSPEELDNYMKDVMNGREDKDGLVLSTFTGGNARKAADDYAEALHSVQEAYYLGDDATKQSLTTLQDYTAEELRAIDLTDNFQTDMEGQFVDLMKSLNISEDQVEQFINVLEDMGLLKIEPEVDLSQITSVDKLNSTIAGQLSTGQSMTFTADVEGIKGIENEIKAIKQVDGTIKYTVTDKDGTEKEVEPLKNQDGTITYHVVPEEDKNKNNNGKKKNKKGDTIVSKTEVDTNGFEKGSKQIQQGVHTLSKETATPHVDLKGAQYASSQISNVRSMLNSLTTKKNIYINTIRRTINDKKNNQSNKEGGVTKHIQFTGTFHTSNAYAGGTVSSRSVSIQKDENALINEVGREIVVRDGRALTFNNGYPTFANLKKGDVVFSARQSELLEEKGYLRGSYAKLYGTSAFASGTVDDEDEFEELSNAYKDASTNRAGGPKITSHTTTKKKKSTSKSTKNSSNKKKSSSSSKKKKGTSKNKAWENFENWISQLFDWVEVRLERLSEKTERWTNLFEKFLNASSANAQRAYNAAIDAAKAEQRYTTTASNRYLSEALDVGLKGAQAAGTKKVKGKKVRRISDQWVRNIYQRLLNDNLNETEIKKMSEKQRSLIDAMQDYIGKAKDAAKSTVELTDAVNDLIKAQRDAKVEFKKSALSSMVESDNRYGASSKNSALSQSSTVARYAITSFDESVNGGNSYLGTLASQAKSAGTFAYTKKKVKGKKKKKTVAANANTKIYQSLKGADKTNYKKYITSATSYMNKGEVIPQKIVDFFERFNPSLAAKYEAWNAQVANLEVLRQEAADNYAENIKTIIGNISESYANIDEDTDNAISLIESQAENMESTAANDALNKIRQHRANIIANDQAEIDTYNTLIGLYSGKISGNHKGTNFSKASVAVQNKVNKAVDNARTAVSSSQKISDSLMMELYDYYTQGYLLPSFFESCLAYNLTYDAAAQAVDQKKIDEATQKQELLSLYDKKASNISSFRDANVSRIEARKNSLSGSYDDTITQAEIIAEREKEITELRENLADAVKNGDIVENTQPWIERVVEIQEKVNDLNELKLTRFETEIEERFERAIQKADELIDKFDTIKGLIDEEMLYNKDSGVLTDTGWLALGLDSKKLAEQQENLKRLYEEYDEVVEAYENGERVFGDQTYDEKINEISTNILSLYSDMKSVNDDMFSIMEGQADAELEALQKIVDKRKEALQKKKE